MTEWNLHHSLVSPLQAERTKQRLAGYMVNEVYMWYPSNLHGNYTTINKSHINGSFHQFSLHLAFNQQFLLHNCLWFFSFGIIINSFNPSSNIIHQHCKFNKISSRRKFLNKSSWCFWCIQSTIKTGGSHILFWIKTNTISLVDWNASGVEFWGCENTSCTKPEFYQFRPHGHISIIFGKYNHLRVSLLTQHLDYSINRQYSLVYRILGIIHWRWAL